MFLTRERGEEHVLDDSLKSRRPIWTASEQGEPLRVHDEARYKAEMKRLGLDVPEYVIDKNAPELQVPLEGQDGGDEG